MAYPYYPNYVNPQNYLYSQQAQPQAAPQTSTGLIWVQGEAGAKSYLVGAGQSVLLMDSESSTFYIKSTDASGMPLPLRVFDYKERVQMQEQTQTPPMAMSAFDPDKYVTKDEFNRLVERLKKEAHDESVV